MRKTIRFALIVVIVCLTTVSSAAEVKTGIENFPESYRGYLQILKAKHPNWVFSALYTGLDYNDVILNEYANNRNLVPMSYSDEWKCREDNLYNIEIDLGWVNASKQAIEYTMDPRNFLSEIRVFQFEKLSYDNNIHTKKGIEKILYGTEFYNKKVTYKLASGNIVNMDKTYADLIWEAAVYSGVSPYNLAARIKQELGGFINNASISGTVPGFEGLYNFYNIGATSSTETLGAVKNGLVFARDGKGLNNTEKSNLFIPWDSPEKAIKGGAIFIGNSYISVGQNNLYLQKFSVNSSYPEKLFWHQYMTNCLAPYNESYSMYKAYLNNEMLDSSIGFLIPVYENMPWTMAERPGLNNFRDDSTTMYANVTTTLNVRTGPGTDFEILTSIPANTVVTRIKKQEGDGETWDKVTLANGIVGYCFSTYLKKLNETEWNISFDKSLKINGNVISGLPSEELRTSDMAKLINTNLNIDFETSVNGVIGTGSKLILTKNDGSGEVEYEFILYGDLNGDGVINSLDLLILQKHILEISVLEGIFYKAGNLSKDGQPPSSLDMLKIKKHILEISLIDQ